MGRRPGGDSIIAGSMHRSSGPGIRSSRRSASPGPPPNGTAAIDRPKSGLPSWGTPMGSCPFRGEPLSCREICGFGKAPMPFGDLVPLGSGMRRPGRGIANAETPADGASGGGPT